MVIIILGTIWLIYPKSNVLSVPPYLKKGDLLFCDVKPDFISKLEEYNITYYQPYMRSGLSNDHVAMYIGDNMFIESSPYYWNEDKHSWIGVVTTHIGLLNLWGTNITYGIINNVTIEQKINAVDWALDKIGNSYSNFSCGELISESYKNQDIDLCPNKYSVNPSSLIHSKQIKIIENENNGFWYPTLYIKWYVICLFDYIDDISESQMLKDVFYIIQSIIS
ncbi:hypothetical protein ACFL1L_00375 [Thermoplasmatota archaeon]